MISATSHGVLPPCEGDECTAEVTECMDLEQLCSTPEAGEGKPGKSRGGGGGHGFLRDEDALHSSRVVAQVPGQGAEVGSF